MKNILGRRIGARTLFLLIFVFLSVAVVWLFSNDSPDPFDAPQQQSKRPVLVEDREVKVPTPSEQEKVPGQTKVPLPPPVVTLPPANAATEVPPGKLALEAWYKAEQEKVPGQSKVPLPVVTPLPPANAATEVPPGKLAQEQSPVTTAKPGATVLDSTPTTLFVPTPVPTVAVPTPAPPTLSPIDSTINKLAADMKIVAAGVKSLAVAVRELKEMQQPKPRPTPVPTPIPTPVPHVPAYEFNSTTLEERKTPSQLSNCQDVKKKLLPPWDPVEFMEEKIRAFSPTHPYGTEKKRRKNAPPPTPAPTTTTDGSGSSSSGGGGNGGKEGEESHPIPSPEKLRENLAIEGFCALYKEKPLPESERVNLIYGTMFNFEAPMLEVLLNEIYPMVSSIILIESSTTHNLAQKVAVWPTIVAGNSSYGNETAEAFAPFLDKIRYHFWNPSERQRETGWSIERGQREELIHQLYLNAPPELKMNDIIIGNMDLDEIPSRTLLTRYKYCRLLHAEEFKLRIFHFRYHLGCLQTPSVDDQFHTIFRWPGRDDYAERKSLLRNIYKARAWRQSNIMTIEEIPQRLPLMLQHDASTAWHMSTFDGLKNVIRKYKNSPHGFVRNLNETEIAHQLESCIHQGGNPMYRVAPFLQHHPESLPWFMGHNMCYYFKRGWLGGFSDGVSNVTTTSPPSPVSNATTTAQVAAVQGNTTTGVSNTTSTTSSSRDSASGTNKQQASKIIGAGSSAGARAGPE